MATCAGKAQLRAAKCTVEAASGIGAWPSAARLRARTRPARRHGAASNTGAHAAVAARPRLACPLPNTEPLRPDERIGKDPAQYVQHDRP